MLEYMDIRPGTTVHPSAIADMEAAIRTVWHICLSISRLKIKFEVLLTRGKTYKL